MMGIGHLVNVTKNYGDPGLNIPLNIHKFITGTFIARKIYPSNWDRSDSVYQDIVFFSVTSDDI